MKYEQESVTRYVFFSDSRKSIAHIVDLLDGECSCEQFQFRIKPLLERGVIDVGDSVSKCKHIKKARDLLCDQVIEQMKEGGTSS
jgi:hypothetical protein